jgi:hypothetical protein
MNDSTYDRNSHNIIIITGRAQNMRPSIQSKQVDDKSNQHKEDLNGDQSSLT